MLELAVLFYAGVVGTDVHEFGYGAAAPAHGIVLEAFTDAVKEHDCNRLGVFADADSADGGNGHEEVLLEQPAAQKLFRGLLKSIKACDEVGHKEKQQNEPALHAGDLFRNDPHCGKQHGGYGDKQNVPLHAAVIMAAAMLFVVMSVFMVMHNYSSKCSRPIFIIEKMCSSSSE